MWKLILLHLSTSSDGASAAKKARPAAFGLQGVLNRIFLVDEVNEDALLNEVDEADDN